MKELNRLLQIMADLRDPESGCPWDIKQSFETIAPYTVEEAYEVADAIERHDMDELKSELGDLLFQVVFHSQLAAEQGQFTFNDVVDAINEKLIRRHPHVFGDSETRDVERLAAEWEAHKKAEREAKGKAMTGRLSGIAAGMPALRWSEKLQKRAIGHGFDWDSIDPVFAKIEEELDELKAELVADPDQARISDEMGDVLFACVNLAHHVKVNPEQALRQANRKFIKRFEIVEQLLLDDKKQMEECSVEVLLDYWQKAKVLIHHRDRELRDLGKH